MCLILRAKNIEVYKELKYPFNISNIKNYLRIYHNKDDLFLENIANEVIGLYEKYFNANILQNEEVLYFEIDENIMSNMKLFNLDESYRGLIYNYDNIQKNTLINKISFYIKSRNKFENIYMYNDEEVLAIDQDKFYIQDHIIYFSAVIDEIAKFKVVLRSNLVCKINFDIVSPLMKTILNIYQQSEVNSNIIFNRFFSKNKEGNFI